MPDPVTLPNGASFRFAGKLLECLFLSSDMVRVSWQPGEAPLASLLSDIQDNLSINLKKIRQGWLLQGDILQLTVTRAGSLIFQDVQGNLLKKDHPPKKHGSSWTVSSPLRTEETLHGLGLRAAPLNLRPGTYHMWNRDPGSYGPGDDPLYLCIPSLLARHNQGNYILFFENSFQSVFSFKTQPAEAKITFSRGLLRYYFLFGSLNHILDRYTELTGRPTLPPRWALGFHQSRWGYKSQKDVRQVVKGFDQHKLPLSAIHLDIDHMRGYRVFTVDKRRFPSLKKLTSELKDKGISLVSIIDPGVKKDNDYRLYQEGKTKGLFCTRPNGQPVQARVWPGFCVFPDFISKKTRNWWAKQYEYLIKKGISGFWHDMNEPAAFENQYNKTLPLDSCHDLAGEKKDHEQVHNLYGLFMAKSGFGGLLRHLPNHRPWILSRSGWAGIQSYAWNWTGDIESSWAALRQTIPSVINLGLSGVPFTGPDIGGFSGSPSKELFIRWFQLATFLPFFRVHCAWDTESREPWVFGQEATDIIRTFLKLRFQLIPYLYTLAWQASKKGSPLVRPLFWDFPEDNKTRDLQDEFLLGDSLLIAPALYPGMRSRRVYLPESSWYNFWNGALVSGSDRKRFKAPLMTIPILVKSGTVLPLEMNDHINLHVYPLSINEQESNSYVYSDAGDGYGQGRLDDFKQFRIGNTLNISWISQGSFPWPYKKILLHFHGQEPDHIQIDGQTINQTKDISLSSQFSKITATWAK